MANNNRTNYKKISDGNKAQDLRPYIGKRAEMKPVDEAIPTDVKKEVTKALGKVTAPLLRVRVAPYIDSDVIERIKEDSEVSIDLKTSTEDWYAVTTEAGERGFCMKRFIAVC